MKIRPILMITVGVLCYYHYTRPRTVTPGGPTPVPVQPVTPNNTRPLIRSDDAEANSSVGGPEYNGTSVICDLPVSQHLRNKAGIDRAGLCVFTSIDMMANWLNYPTLIGFRDYMTKFNGGGFPEKVDEYIVKIAKERNLPVPVKGVDYGQIEGVTAEKLIAIVGTYRMVAITYGNSPRYISPRNPQGNVSHMVDLVHIDSKVAAILDNNFPGTIEWMPTPELIRRCKLEIDKFGGVHEGQGWAVWLSNPPPPPVPIN